MEKVNLADKFAKISEYWKPYIAGELNGQLVKLDKLKGEFVWHKHDETDDFFLVLKGRLTLHLRDRVIVLLPGELFIVPKGVDHRPTADEETHLLLIEPIGTPNTGNSATAAPAREI